MNKQYFYLKPYTGEISEEKVTLYQIKNLALFATTLEALPEVSEPAGLATALFTFFQTNSEHELANTFFKLQASEKGNEILCLSIGLCLLEEAFQEQGITPELAERYNNILKAYNTCLELNKTYKNETNPSVGLQ